MELLIKSLMEAVKYRPVKKAYAIRISSEYSLDHLYPLVDSENWVKISSYVFDDVWPGMPGLDPRDVLLDDDKAQRILLDFKDYIPQTETLLVQCQEGIYRSSAVGIALNEIFGLGHDADKLKKEHPEYRRFVYEMLLKAGKKLEL